MKNVPRKFFDKLQRKCIWIKCIFSAESFKCNSRLAIVVARRKACCVSNGARKTGYCENNPLRYFDPDGTNIKEIALYNISAGFLVAGRISVGVAIDSNCDMDVFIKFELL